MGVKIGFKAGYSLASQYGILEPDIPYKVDVDSRHGVAGALLIYFPITESFGIQQEYLFVQKGSREDIELKDRPIITRTEYDLNYFELPISMRLAFARIKKCNIYMSSGFSMSILLGGEYRLSGTVEINDELATFEDTNKIDSIDLFDFGFLYGAGVDCQLFGKKCFLEYRYTIDWNTLMMPTAEGEDPAPLRNMNYVFALGFYL
jgi:hypothetical protein